MGLLDMESMPGSGSAIATMLHSLLSPPQGAPGSAPNAGGGLPSVPTPPVSSMPMVPPPMAHPEQPQSMVGRIHDRLSGLLDSVRPSTPSGYEGLLTPEEIESARPGRLASLIGSPDAPNPQDRYRANLNNIIQMKQLAGGIAEHHRQEAALQAMATLFPALPDTATPEQQIHQMRSQYDYLMSHGLYEQAKDVGSNLRGMMSMPKAPTDAAPHTIETNKGIYQWNPATKKYEPTGMAAPEKAGPSDHFTAVPGVDPATGKPTVFTLNTRTGQMVSSGVAKPGGAGSLAAPMAAKVGQFGEMLKKASDLLPAMQDLSVSVGQSAARDMATNGIGVAGHAIPGTHGIGSLLMNRTPEYSKYQAMVSPFVLAAAHALSGARINQDQAKQIRESIEIQPGDLNNPAVMAQKKKNMVDLINSIGGSLPQDAIGDQEGQMDAASLTMLRGHGYRGTSSKGSGSATGSHLDAYRHLLK